MRILIWTILVTLVATNANADIWQSTEASTLSFVVQTEDAKLAGTFATFQVALTTAADDDKLEYFEVTVQLTAADMGDSELNTMLLDDAWFNANKYPAATFKATKIISTPTSTFEVEGVLDLKGVKKTLNFPIEFNRDENSASIKGSTPINRNDFGVGSGEWASSETVGLTVELTFDVQLNRDR